MDTGRGTCAHGAGVVWLEDTVVFIDRCDPCVELLRAEGYHVHEPDRELAAA